jgi:hypothetical protein
MTQIYQSQAQLNAEIAPPNTDIAEYMDKKAEAGLSSLDKMLQHNMQVQQKRRIEQQDFNNDLLKASALQVIRNAETEFGSDPARYQEVTDQGLAKLFDAVPESAVKDRILGEVELAKSGADARVRNDARLRQEKLQLEALKDASMSRLGLAISNASNGMLTGVDLANATTDEVQQKLNAYRDTEAQLTELYLQRYAQDSRGNFVFSDSERAAIADRFENLGMYAAIDYVSDNIQNNYAGAAALKKRFAENKEEIKKSYGLSEDAYNKTLKSMDAVLSGQRGGGTEKQIQSVNVELSSRLNAMQIKPDKNGSLKITNGRFNNLTDSIALLSAYEEAEATGMFPDAADRNRYNKDAGTLRQVIVDQIENNETLKVRRNRFYNLGLPADNVGEAALRRINENLDQLEKNSGIQNKDQLLEYKTRMYIQTLSELNKAHIPLNSKTEQKKADVIANRIYSELVQSITGPVDLEPAGKDELKKRILLNNALLYNKNNGYKNNVQANIDNILDGR